MFEPFELDPHGGGVTGRIRHAFFTFSSSFRRTPVRNRREEGQIRSSGRRNELGSLFTPVGEAAV